MATAMRLIDTIAANLDRRPCRHTLVEVIAQDSNVSFTDSYLVWDYAREEFMPNKISLRGDGRRNQAISRIYRELRYRVAYECSAALPKPATVSGAPPSSSVIACLRTPSRCCRKNLQSRVIQPTRPIWLTLLN